MTSPAGQRKVLHVSPSFARADGGPSEVIRQLLPALEKAGVSVSLLTTDKKEYPGERDELQTQDIHIARSIAAGAHLNLARNLLGPLAQMISTADIVHVHSINNYVSSAAVRLAWRARKRIFVQPHGSLTAYQRDHASIFRTLWDQTVDRRLPHRASTVVSSSSLECEQLPAPWKKRVINLPLGVDPSLFAQQRDPETDDPFILFLGRVSAKKRLDLVLRAMTSEELLGFKLVVAGPLPPTDSKIHNLTRSLGINDRVTFLGQVSAIDRRRLLSRAAVFTLPSDDESFGIAPAEAMAAGCPVVISANVGIASDYVNDAGTPPFLIAPSDPQHLALTIASAAAKDIGEQRISAAARAYAEKNFDWLPIARQLALEYEKEAEQ